MENFIFCAVYIHQVPTKHPQEKTLDPRKYPREKIWTHEIPTRKKFGPMKYPQRYDGTMALDLRDPRWYVGTEGTNASKSVGT